jgi:CheY-like chemotaxis protein
MRSLVISPFAAERIALTELLRSEGHEVTAVSDRSEGLALAGTERPDAVIVHEQRPGATVFRLELPIAGGIAG